MLMEFSDLGCGSNNTWEPTPYVQGILQKKRRSNWHLIPMLIADHDKQQFLLTTINNNLVDSSCLDSGLDGKLKAGNYTQDCKISPTTHSPTLHIRTHLEDMDFA